jgi:hypothetical protein
MACLSALRRIGSLAVLIYVLAGRKVLDQSAQYGPGAAPEAYSPLYNLKLARLNKADVVKALPALRPREWRSQKV